MHPDRVFYLIFSRFWELTTGRRSSSFIKPGDFFQLPRRQ